MLSKSGIGKWTINLKDGNEEEPKPDPRARRTGGYSHGRRRSSVIERERIKQDKREAARKHRSKLESFLAGLSKRDATQSFDLMMKLKTRDMSQIERAFDNQAELTLPAFVTTLRAFLPAPESEEEEEELVAKLADLFEQVDTLGEGVITWTEFTAFVVEQGISASQQTFVDVIRQYNPSPVQDLSMRQQPIERVVYVPGIDKIAISERFSSRIQLLDPDTLAVAHAFAERPGPASTFVAMEPIPEMEVLAAASSNHSLSFFDHVHAKPGLAPPHLTRDLKTNEGSMIRTLRWCSATQTLYSGDALGVIRLWRAEAAHTGVPGPQDWRVVSTLRGVHSEAVTAIALLDTIDSIATASADRRIKLFNVHTMTLRRELGPAGGPPTALAPDRDGHRQGIYSLAFNAEYRYLFSSGFDSDVFVWNPFMERLVARLTGHKRPLLGVFCIPETPQLISGDTAGVIRIWDIRKMDGGACVQEFTRAQAIAATQGPTSLLAAVTQPTGPTSSRTGSAPLTTSSILGRTLDVTALCVLPEMKRIVAADKRLHLWEYGEAGDRSLTDPVACVGAHFDGERMQIVTAAGRSVRLWDAETGRLMRVDRDIVPQGEITAMTVGPGARRYYVGDSKGRIACHSAVQGALVKLFEPHAADVSALAHIPSDRTLVSASRDATILVHDDSNLTGGIVLRTIVAHANEVSALAVSPSLGLLASGSIDSTLAVWDFGSARLEGLAAGHEADVTALLFLGSRPLLASADSHGLLNLYLTRPAPYPNRQELLYSQRNVSRDGLPAAVLAMELDDSEGRALLYTGDDAGEVKVWSLKRVFEFVDAFLLASLGAPLPPAEEPGPPRPRTAPDGTPAAPMAPYPSPPRTAAVHRAKVNAVAETGKAARMHRVSVLVNAQDKLASQAAASTRRASFAGTAGSLARALMAFRRSSRTEKKGEEGEEDPEGGEGGQPGRKRRGSAAGKADLPEMPLVRSWKAHGEGIRAIQVVRSPAPALITVSYDRLVHVWDESGRNMGTLRQGDASEAPDAARRASTTAEGPNANGSVLVNMRARGWRAPWSAAAKRERELARARALIAQMPPSPPPTYRDDATSPRPTSAATSAFPDFESAPSSSWRRPRSRSPGSPGPPRSPNPTSPAFSALPPDRTPATPDPLSDREGGGAHSGRFGGRQRSLRRAGWADGAPPENALAATPPLAPLAPLPKHRPGSSPRLPQPPATPRAAAASRYGLSPRGPARPGSRG